LKKLLKRRYDRLEIVFRKIGPLVVVDGFIDHPLLAITRGKNLVASFLELFDLFRLLCVSPIIRSLRRQFQQLALPTDDRSKQLSHGFSKHLRKQLDSSERLHQAGLTYSASYRSLEAIKRNTTESKEEFQERVTTDIQELMNDEISARQVNNE